MPKFFVPTAWDNLANALKFRSKPSLGEGGSGGGGNKEAIAAQTIKTKLKKKKKNKKRADESEAATTNSKSAEHGKTKDKQKANKLKKVKDGRITKSKTKSLGKPMIAPVPPVALPTGSKASSSQKKRIKKAKQKAAKEQQRQDAGDGQVLEKTDSTATVTSAKTSGEKIGAENAKPMDTSADVGLEIFENSLKHQLLGGRFRYINEQLYSMNSVEADKFFKSDADAFEAYHAGYQQQVEKWPMNPLDRIIKLISRLPKTLVIVDFGCGVGRLAMSVPNKVYSLDLVSKRSDIIACDMAKTPLHDQSADIAVYCLSLMGTNLKEYLLEANRVLRDGGLVIIAEIQSRFDDVRSFLRGVEACGFELFKRDINKKLFYFFQFKKVRSVGKVALIPPFSLKPCLYRKR